MVYGIPEFRLPKDIVDREVRSLEKMGVDIQLDMVIGRIESVDELMDCFLLKYWISSKYSSTPPGFT